MRRVIQRRLQYVLPSGVTCDGDSHCVLRWHYTGWNNAGVGALGQEHFWNCADVYISNTCGASNPTPSSAKPSTSAVATQAPRPTQPQAPSTSKPTIPTQPPQTSAPSNPTPAPVPGQCGTCANCYYAPTNACFAGWSAAQCAQVPVFKWCGV
ncbi:hypothetical protein DYB37_005513 [Aphanomyces astaci]|uniref:Uncharacterized protein n=1 Tax=Aphanomyces astaci TaxID=112090 RepID=A0A418ES80_APHAT|nr:hypothetical protein DYB37_005513 [Aphanomyces astaci]